MEFVRNMKVMLTLLILVLGLTVVSANAQLIKYDLDDGAGLTAANSGTLGSSHDGTLAGGLNDTDWVAGKFGGALDLAVWGEQVEIPAIDLTSNTMTITTWAKRHGTQGFTGLIYTSVNAVTAWSGIHVVGDGELKYDWNSGMHWPLEFGLFMPDEEWTFIALVVEPDQTTFYMQPESGVMQSFTHLTSNAPAPWNTAPGAQQGTVIGRDPDNRYFFGTVDDARIYDRSLNANEIAAIVPEPASMTLLSLCGLSLLRRRKR